jgi:hypothetical protein
MKNLLIFGISIILFISCNIDKRQLNFIEKLNLYQINSIKVYNFCEALLDTNDISLCSTFANIPPNRLIIPYNMVDSIYDRQKIKKYKDFILNYNTLSYDSIDISHNMDIRIALIVEFDNLKHDTLCFVGTNKIQVNEAIILDYENKIKSIFLIPPIKESFIKNNGYHF